MQNALVFISQKNEIFFRENNFYCYYDYYILSACSYRGFSSTFFCICFAFFYYFIFTLFIIIIERGKMIITASMLLSVYYRNQIYSACLHLLSLLLFFNRRSDDAKCLHYYLELYNFSCALFTYLYLFYRIRARGAFKVMKFYWA